eukprot:615971-Prymnesium_polylepis.1
MPQGSAGLRAPQSGRSAQSRKARPVGVRIGVRVRVRVRDRVRVVHEEGEGVERPAHVTTTDCQVTGLRLCARALCPQRSSSCVSRKWPSALAWLPGGEGEVRVRVGKWPSALAWLPGGEGDMQWGMVGGCSGQSGRLCHAAIKRSSDQAIKRSSDQAIK